MARWSSHHPLSGHLVSGHLSPQIISRLSAFDPADLGPHAQALWRNLCGAAAAGLPLAVVALAAAMVDVVQHEEAGPAGYLDGAAFSFAGNKAALGWLRGRRNACGNAQIHIKFNTRPLNPWAPMLLLSAR